MKRFPLILSVIAILVVSAACGGGNNERQPAQGDARGNDGPSWIYGEFDGDAGRVFRGVGSITGVRNRSAAIQAAGAKARTEIARQFNTFVQDLMEMYQRSTTAGDMSASSEEQDVMIATRTFTEMQLSGTRIVRTYCDRENPPTCYALAEMDLQAFSDAMSQQNELSPRVRDYVRQNAAQAYDRLDQQSATNQERQQNR